MTKKKKGIILAVVLVLVIAAVGCGLYFGLSKDSADAASGQVAEGEIYRTKTESFWVGVGKAYMSFQHKEAPEGQADDGELYGNVFYVMVSSGESFDPWLSGSWELDEANGKLTLQATWDETAENQTKLADAESGVAKVYLAENGEYKIPVDLPSASVTFTLNPQTDKVGSMTSTDEAEPVTETPAETEQDTGNLFARLTAEDSLFDGDVKGYAQIDMQKDGAWTMYVKVEPYVPSYVAAVTGKWTENADGSVTLSVSGGDYKDSLDKTFTFKKAADGTYSGTLKFTADAANGIVFSFNFKSVDISESTTVSTKPVSTGGSSATQNTAKTPAAQKGELYRTAVYHGIYSGIVGDAYISFMDLDKPTAELNMTGKVFAVYVDAGEGYSPWITGTWSLNADNTKLTLNQQKGSGDAGLTGATAGKDKVYTANAAGDFTIGAFFPSGGKATLTFNPAKDKVSGGSTATPNNPNTDKPNTDKPNTDTPETPEQGDIVLTAFDSLYDGAVTCDAVLTVKTDNTWALTTTIYGSTIENAVTGTWADGADNAIVLTVTNQVTGAEMQGPVTLKYDAASGKYSGTVNLLCNGSFRFTLNFEGGASGDNTVAVTGISLNKTTLSLAVGKSETLTATITPANATEKGVVWTSANPEIAQVQDGKVTANAAGTTTVIASSKDGGFTATCTVTVTEPSEETEYYVAGSDDTCNGFPMSLIFEDGSFHLFVDTTYFDASEWFKGAYAFNADKTQLTLYVGYNANGPHLAEAEATESEAVTYTAQDGKFTIAVKDPSASNVNGTFVLSLEGTDVPEEPDDSGEPENPPAAVQMTLTASDTLDLGTMQITANAKLELFTDNTFKLSVDAGQGYLEAASGSWALDAGYNMQLTVIKQTVANSLPETITLYVDYSTFTYSGTVTYTASAYTVFTFDFAPEANAPALDKAVTLTAADSLYGGAVTCDAVLTVQTDGTWTMEVTVYGNTIPNAVSGSWKKDEKNDLVLTATQMVDGASVPETITLAYNEAADAYSGTVALNCMGQFDFTLNFQ